MTQNKTNTCEMNEYRAGDEVLFKFNGLLLGTVERVRFDGCKVRYQLTLNLECDVPEGQIVGTHDEKGEAAGR